MLYIQDEDEMVGKKNKESLTLVPLMIVKNLFGSSIYIIIIKKILFFALFLNKHKFNSVVWKLSNSNTFCAFDAIKPSDILTILCVFIEPYILQRYAIS